MALIAQILAAVAGVLILLFGPDLLEFILDLFGDPKP